MAPGGSSGDPMMLPSWDAAPDEPATPAPPALPAAPEPASYRVRTVSEVARALKDRIRSDEALRGLWVEGEVSRYTVSTAGHAYFTLKDARAQLGCVWFRDDRVRSSFQPQAGLAVVVHGRMDVFEAQGAVQLYVESMQPAGFGNLALAFEQTKARLAAEGLFDADRKRPLPLRPPVIALVTSPTGAVRHDVCTVLARRWPLARVVLVPCQVQGNAAPASIVAALRALEAYVADEAAAGREADAPSVTILARGGGSPEDLWAFNDERVVRAVAAHLLPVVAGIGHETDVTLADFAADVRAPTPSAAAELIVPACAPTRPPHDALAPPAEPLTPSSASSARSSPRPSSPPTASGWASPSTAPPVWSRHASPATVGASPHWPPDPAASSRRVSPLRHRRSLPALRPSWRSTPTRRSGAATPSSGARRTGSSSATRLAPRRGSASR